MDVMTPTTKPGIRVKKLAPELRRRRINFSAIPELHLRFKARLKYDSQFQRSLVQIAFLLLCIWIGIEFHYFVKWGMSRGAETFIERPPGVEGFLPISALISLKYWVETGIINSVHPSGLVIFLAIVAGSLALKKSFCSWLCPIGTLSESLGMLGKKIFKRHFEPPRWLDYPLRSLKYLLLLFFGAAVWAMNSETLQAFIFSPYNKMADVKMYFFFAEITTGSIVTILVLMGLSMVIRNFWCRYLCPYGALLGLTSLLSPLKIRRNASTCIDCELCTKVCPSRIKVHKVSSVRSDECTSCLQCVEICPVKQTLEVRLPAAKKGVPTWALAALVAFVFVAVTGLGMMSGHWKNGMTESEYLMRFPKIDSPMYQHARGSVPEYGPND
ncbi:MAG: 4Fe-4S binding protein [Acidobacteriota bacterium]